MGTKSADGKLEAADGEEGTNHAVENNTTEENDQAYNSPQEHTHYRFVTSFFAFLLAVVSNTFLVHAKCQMDRADGVVNSAWCDQNALLTIFAFTVIAFIAGCLQAIVGLFILLPSCQKGCGSTPAMNKLKHCPTACHTLPLAIGVYGFIIATLFVGQFIDARCTQESAAGDPRTAWCDTNAKIATFAFTAIALIVSLLHALLGVISALQ